MRNRATKVYAVVAAVVVALVGVPLTASAAPLEDRENVEFSAGGLSSEYHVYADGIDTDQAVGLLLQFHGDGGYEFRNPDSSYSLGGRAGIVAEAREHNLVTAAVRTPDWSSRTWWREGVENADYVAALLAHLQDEFPAIEPDRIWLAGYSGGAQFISQFYLPVHSDTIEGGGAVIIAGGGVPYRVDPQPFADELKAQFPMHWFTGLDDDGSGGSYNALRDARRGSAWYDERGFDTDLETPDGVGHGLSGQFGGIVGKHLDDHVGEAVADPDDGEDPAPDPEPEPEPDVTVEDYTAERTDRGMIFQGTVLGGDEVVLRASRWPLDGQTGWYLYGDRDADGRVEIELTKFDAGEPYYWQLEVDGEVAVSGELPGEPVPEPEPEPDPEPEPEPDPEPEPEPEPDEDEPVVDGVQVPTLEQYEELLARVEDLEARVEALEE